jgi:hypothetical protein
MAHGTCQCMADYIIALAIVGPSYVDVKVTAAMLCWVCQGDIVNLYACTMTCKRWFRACFPLLLKAMKRYSILPWKQCMTKRQAYLAVARARYVGFRHSSFACCECLKCDGIQLTMNEEYPSLAKAYMIRSSTYRLTDGTSVIYLTPYGPRTCQIFCLLCFDKFLTHEKFNGPEEAYFGEICNPDQRTPNEVLRAVRGPTYMKSLLSPIWLKTFSEQSYLMSKNDGDFNWSCTYITALRDVSKFTQPIGFIRA